MVTGGASTAMRAALLTGTTGVAVELRKETTDDKEGINMDNVVKAGLINVVGGYAGYKATEIANSYDLIKPLNSSAINKYFTESTGAVAGATVGNHPFSGEKYDTYLQPLIDNKVKPLLENNGTR